MTDDLELAAEQAYVDRAYDCLERTRRITASMVTNTEDGPGGTFQARYERDLIHDNVTSRLQQLELGDQSLCFGRVDFGESTTRTAGERYYIGRLAVSDETNEPVIVDWRAPVSEAFYRATGVNPMGLEMRRHFASRGRALLGLDDEFFGDAARGLDTGTVSGRGALIAALEEARSGKLSDIVATIQAEQDEVIRSELGGVLVVQGGPGTGKTVVALHRAAYLLYTYRFPLEGQGVLVLGPNRLFLSYIEQVLPSLGEAGVEIAVMADLVPSIRASGSDRTATSRLKGDLRVARLLDRAVRDRQRASRRTIVVPHGVEQLRLRPDDTRELVAYARRRARTHNAGRKHFDQAFFQALSRTMRDPIDPTILRDRVRHLPEVRDALDRMWPVLTPAQLLNDLYGSAALLRLAGSRWFSDEELSLLRRDRVVDPSGITWTKEDVPLLDEALELLGPRPRHRDEDGIRTYGHIVIDEAQDMSPMELRMVDRRSLNGSMTVVGDIAQSTAAGGHISWDDVLAHLPSRRAQRRAELTIGYRLPGPSMELAARVLCIAAPELRPPSSVRESGDPPVIEVVDPERFAPVLAAAIRREQTAVGAGNVAVVAADGDVQLVEEILEAAGIDFGRARRGSLDHQLTVCPVSLVKGLELDACVVVDPQTILDRQHRGAQALYVALTRGTRRLSIVSQRPLPDVLAEPTAAF